MSVYGGYDTDDLTQRQYHYFDILNKHQKDGFTLIALSFLRSCVRKNHSLGQFDNYEDDCEFLFEHEKETEEFGIDLEEVYK